MAWDFLFPLYVRNTVQLYRTQYAVDVDEI